jgi:hypothetical protein
MLSSVSFDHRHSRYGHMLQNRYKSIVCQEDTYFTQLIRYIHLNPLRAGTIPRCWHVARKGSGLNIQHFLMENYILIYNLLLVKHGFVKC